MSTLTQSLIQFDLPDYLACPKPTEARNLRRDQVRLLVTSGAKSPQHAVFNQLDRYLRSGDVLVVNTSATVPSALHIT
ncbi:MAG: S-adenosylmethionine:tRNA ribosyltransferase-isomerase, partial [Cyclobacteriaceae bacterium]